MAWKKTDDIWYSKILTIINEPKLANNKGFLKLSDEDWGI